MDTKTAADRIHVVCPHCDKINRVDSERSRDAVCGGCGNALFSTHPAALRSASLEHQIARSDVPVVVDFWASWCGPCRVMAPVFEQAAHDLEPGLRFIKINTDEETDAARRHRIRAIPTFAIFKNGAETARVSGAMDARAFTAWVRANS